MRSLTNFPLSEHDALLSANAHFALARNYRGITDQLDQFAATGAVSPSLLNSPRSPTMAIRPNANGHIGRPVADVPHFYLDRGFEFSGCFARFLHGSIDPTRNIKFVARLIGLTLSLADLRDTFVFYAVADGVKPWLPIDVLSAN